MEKDKLEKLEWIRKELNELKTAGMRWWIFDELNNKAYKLIEITESQNLSEFLKLKYHDYRDLRDELLRKIINKNTNWLSQPDVVKQIVVSGNGFSRIVSYNALNNFEMWVKILKENEYGFVDSWDTCLLWDYNAALQNEELIELCFTKLKNMHRLFCDFDFTKLDKKYFNDEKYIHFILNSSWNSKVIKRLNKDLVFKNKEIWDKYHHKLVDAYGLEEISEYVDKSLLVSKPYCLTKLVNLDINVFIENYEIIIKDGKLVKASIDGDYNVIKYIKNGDFTDELKEIIVNIVKHLDDNICTH